MNCQMNEEDRRRYSKMFAKLPKSEDGYLLGSSPLLTNIFNDLNEVFIRTSMLE